MAGIYIHIPFCKSRCIYCGFYSTTAVSLMQRYVDALCKEMSLRHIPAPPFLRGSVGTVYFGGGTPSLLTEGQLSQLFRHIAETFGETRDEACEVTIECNPDDVTEAYAAMLRRQPVNRVSMGVQTFSDERLRFFNRRHSAAQVHSAVRWLRQVGDIGNISIDLMYGFPGQTMGEWQRDVDTAISLGVEHISAYALMFEEGTPLYRNMMAEQRHPTATMRFQPIDEDTERQMYELLIDKLTAAGFEHYEISNFARRTTIDGKPHSFRSRHNSSYWTGIPYIGLGAAAHSFDGQCRQWNVSDLRQYLDDMENGHLNPEQEELSGATRYNDLVTVAMRTCEGVNPDTLPHPFRQHFTREARPFLDNGLLKEVDGRISLSRKGLFVSDMIMSQLMMV